MKLSSIAGVVCHVDDLDEAARFYEGLGFRAGKRDGNRVTYYVNWFWVELVAGEEAPGLELCIKVESVDDAYAAVVADGKEPAGEPRPGPAKRREFTLRDPDGHRLVLFEKK